MRVRRAGADSQYVVNTLRLRFDPHYAPAKLPVLVWVHGGSFTAGGTAALDPTPFAKSQRVIVVMVQCRLGAVGRLKADDLSVAGNFRSQGCRARSE